MNANRRRWAASGLLALAALPSGCMMIPHAATMALPGASQGRERPAIEPSGEARANPPAPRTSIAAEPLALRTADGREFPAALTRARRAKGALVLVLDSAATTATGAFGTLPARLAQRGYTVLEIQVTVPGANSGEPSAAQSTERIGIALEFLRASGAARVALVSNSLGALVSEEWVGRNPRAPLVAWVPLAIAGGRFERVGTPAFPVFDVYAERDTEAVLGGAKQRAAVLRSIRGSRQAMLFSAGPGFPQKGEELAALIQSLLDPVMK